MPRNEPCCQNYNGSSLRQHQDQGFNVALRSPSEAVFTGEGPAFSVPGGAISIT